MRHLNSSSFLKKFSLLALVLFLWAPAKSSGGHSKEILPGVEGEEGVSYEEPVGDMILHHVMDSHDWHITDIGETSIALHLPWIVYNSQNGFEFFGSTHSMLEKDEHYLEAHGHLYYVKSRHPIYVGEPASERIEGYEEEHDKYLVLHTKKVAVAENGEKENIEVAAVYELVEGVSVMDFSMSKTGLHVLIIALLMFFVFRAVAKGYKTNEGHAPKGIQSFFEPVILFVRDEVAKPFLHGKHDRFLPYLLTLFFFIWFSNMFGLTPLSSNIAGNTSITVMLALISLVLILANSTKDFWMHIFWFPGVPVFVKPIMFVIEFMGLLTKPAALAIRLFANISAGHFMVLALISLIFILGDNGRSIGGAVGIMPLSIVFSLFIFMVELIVAAVQAFVFAMLTAVFIGQAMESHDDHH